MDPNEQYEKIIFEYRFFVPEQFEDCALDAAEDIKKALGARSCRDPEVLKLLICGAKVGIGSTNNRMNHKESDLGRYIFTYNFKIPIQDIRIELCEGVSESTYATLETIAEMGNDVAIPFLRFVLTFAYVDGKMDEEIALRLKTIFSKNLADPYYGMFKKLGIDEEKYNELAPQIAKYIEQYDIWKTYDEIRSKFSKHTEKEIEATLEGLIKQRYIFDLDGKTGTEYGTLKPWRDWEDI